MNTQKVTVMKNKRLLLILSAVAILLAIPLVAMQFTHEVKWSLADFLVAGTLLTGSGLLCEAILRKVKTTGLRLTLCAIVLLILMVVWAELAVGIFNTPLAGS